MFDRFFLFPPPSFDNRHQSSSSVVVTVLAGRSETVSPLKQFPRVRVTIRSAPNVHARSSGTRTVRTHHHRRRRRFPFLSLSLEKFQERIEEEQKMKFSKKKKKKKILLFFATGFFFFLLSDHMRMRIILQTHTRLSDKVV